MIWPLREDLHKKLRVPVYNEQTTCYCPIISSDSTEGGHLRKKKREASSIIVVSSVTVVRIMGSIQDGICEGIFRGTNAPSKEASQRQVINQ